MNLGNLPGFYWDEEKKKYFAIQKNHKATSKDAKYTKADVTRRAEESRKRKRKAKIKQRQDKELIRRSRLLLSPLLVRSTIGREIGGLGTSIRTTSDVQARSFVGGLGSRCLMDPAPDYDQELEASRCAAYSSKYSKLFLPRQEPAVYWPTRNVTPSLLVAGVVSGRNEHGSLALKTFDNMAHLEGIDHNRISRELEPFSAMDDQTTGMAISPSGRYMIATCYGFQNAVQAVVYDLDRIFAPSHIRHDLEPPCSDIYIRSRQPFPFNTCLASPNRIRYANIDEPAECFVVGSEWGIHLVDHDRVTREWQPETLMKTNSNTWAMDFLQPNVIIAGCMNGNIYLYDLRAERPNLTAEAREHIAMSSNYLNSFPIRSPRLTHGSPIAKVKRGLHDSQIIVAGMDKWKNKGRMKLYDLRFAPKAPDSSTTTCSPYVFDFANYKAPTALPHGLDTFYDLGLLANGAENAIQFFSMHNGSLLDEVRLNNHRSDQSLQTWVSGFGPRNLSTSHAEGSRPPRKDNRQTKVHDLTFVDEGNAVSLLAAYGNSVWCCSW